MLKLINIFFLLNLANASAQFPDTDVWVFKLGVDKEKKTTLVEALNISNRSGYDNQPSFSQDSKKLFYVSVRDDNQADIYQYDLRTKKQKQITHTSESEFSPVPFENGNTLTAVLVEKDSAQRIHFIDALAGNHVSAFEFDSVGYYAFINTDTVVYYKLSQPHSLRFYVNSTQEDKFICDNPIKSFHRINRHSFLYGINDKSKVTFYKYDFLLRKALHYAPGFAPDSYRHADATFWHPKYGLLCAVGGKILRYDENEKLWLTYFDLTSYGIENIARFAFDERNNYLTAVQSK
jgi:hypothetical protein